MKNAMASTPLLRIAAVLALTCVPAFAQQPAPANPDADKEDWIVLFNGRDLTGWTPKITKHELGDNFGNTFRVEDGLLKVRYDQYTSFDGQFGHLFYKDPFSYYRLRVEYRFVGQQAPGNPGAWALRNSGVMMHSPDPRTMPRDQDFPISIEGQLLGGNSDGTQRPTANMCSPGTEIVYEGKPYPEHCLNSTSPTFDGEQWVQAEFEVHGSGTVTHFVNGQKVLEYELPQFGGGFVNNYDTTTKLDGQLLEGGYISLQSESHPVDFRRVELLNLAGCMDRNATNYKSYFIKNVPEDCTFAEGAKPAMRRPGEYPLMPDSLPQPNVPRGRLEGPFEFHSKIIAGTVRRYWVWVPAQYDAEDAGQRARVPGRPAGHEPGGQPARAAGYGEPDRAEEDAGHDRHLHHAGQSERDLSDRSRHVESESPGRGIRRARRHLHALPDRRDASRGGQDVQPHERPGKARDRRHVERRDLRVHGGLAPAGRLPPRHRA